MHDTDTRKRKTPESPTVEEELVCSDIFSFDSDDDGPKNPKRGMGYKMADKPSTNNGPGAKSTKRINNDKTCVTKPKKTNSVSTNNTHKTSLLDPKKTVPKQTSMDAFMSSNHTKSNVRQATSVRSQPRSLQHNKPMKKTKKKFFRSSLNSSNESITDHNYSHPEDSSDDGVTQPSEDEDTEKNIDKDTFNSDDLDELESGDPEIIFNSPKKRSAEKQKNSQLHLPKLPVVSSSENDAIAVNDSDSVCSGQSLSPVTRRRLKAKVGSGAGSDTSAGSDGSIRLERVTRGRLGILDRSRDKHRKPLGKPIVRRLLTSPKKVGLVVSGTYLHGVIINGVIISVAHYSCVSVCEGKQLMSSCVSMI